MKFSKKKQNKTILGEQTIRSIMYKLLRSFRVKQNHNFVVCRRHNSNAIGLSGARKEVPSTGKISLKQNQNHEFLKMILFGNFSKIDRKFQRCGFPTSFTSRAFHYCESGPS